MDLGSNRGRRPRRAMMCEINVVPYIDVMLVLLIIFMTTAPLLTEGVDVNLPKANAKVVENPDEVEKVIVSIDAQGSFYINEEKEPSSLAVVRAKARAFYNERPDLPFYVKGDAAVPYEQVMQAMVALQQAGVPSVGLVTRPVSETALPPLETDEEIENIRSIEMKVE